MLEENQEVYYISYDYSIKKALYKGEVHICPYKYNYHLYRETDDEIEQGSNEDGNFLINQDYVFINKEEAEDFLDDIKL